MCGVNLMYREKGGVWGVGVHLKTKQGCCPCVVLKFFIDIDNRLKAL